MPIVIDESAESSDTLPFHALRLSLPTAAQQRRALLPEDFALVAQIDSPNAALLAAQALLMGAFQRWLSLKSMALEAYPNNRDLYFARMQTAMMAGDPQLAMADALALIRLADDNPYAYLTIMAALASEERCTISIGLKLSILLNPSLISAIGAVWTIAA